MNPELHDEIERVAYGLYEQSGREEGKDLINWFAAEKIVLGRLARPGRISGYDSAVRQHAPPARRNGRKNRAPS